MEETIWLCYKKPGQERKQRLVIIQEAPARINIEAVGDRCLKDTYLIKWAASSLIIIHLYIIEYLLTFTTNFSGVDADTGEAVRDDLTWASISKGSLSHQLAELLKHIYISYPTFCWK